MPGIISTQNLGRQTYFGQWTPQLIEHRCLEYQYTKLGRQTYFSRWPTWVIEQRCLEYQYTKLGRQTYFGRWPPWVIEQRCLEYCYTKLGRTNLDLANGPPQMRMDFLKTITLENYLASNLEVCSYLSDEPSLARWTSPGNRA